MDAPAAPQANVFARYFRHLPRYYIVVCVKCRTAVIPKHAAAHLARNHDRITKEERICVQRYIDGLEDVARDVLDVRFPAPEDPPCGEIIVQYGGLRCLATGEDGRQCRHVVRTTRMIKAHCETAHGWRNEQRRGGNMRQKKAQPPNRIWDKGQAYQQFFNEPSWKRNTPTHYPANNIAGYCSGSTRVRTKIRTLIPEVKTVIV
jgi:hypothetical protein